MDGHAVGGIGGEGVAMMLHEKPILRGDEVGDGGVAGRVCGMERMKLNHKLAGVELCE